MNALFAALTLGFLGSFHCIGMCGPIALTIPVKRTSAFSIFSGSLVYNAGRVITYAFMGLLFGALGQGFALAGLQNALSVTIGTGILVLLVIPTISLLPKGFGPFMQVLEKLKSKIRGLFGIHTYRSLLLIGLLNGLLPCGLVYLGIAGSIAVGDIFKGSLFMMFFGIGTMPAMLSITMIRDRISLRFRESIRKVIPVFVGIMAVMLILRGLNLGIPYLSPSVECAGGITHHQCCHK